MPMYRGHSDANFATDDQSIADTDATFLRKGTEKIVGQRRVKRKALYHHS